MEQYHYYLNCCYFKVPRCISSPLLSLMAAVSPDWMNSMTPKGSSFFRTVMLTSLWLPRRLGGVLWLLSTTEKVSSSCMHTHMQKNTHTHTHGFHVANTGLKHNYLLSKPIGRLVLLAETKLYHYQTGRTSFCSE